MRFTSILFGREKCKTPFAVTVLKFDRTTYIHILKTAVIPMRHTTKPTSLESQVNVDRTSCRLVMWPYEVFSAASFRLCGTKKHRRRVHPSRVSRSDGIPQDLGHVSMPLWCESYEGEQSGRRRLKRRQNRWNGRLRPQHSALSLIQSSRMLRLAPTIPAKPPLDVQLR